MGIRFKHVVRVSLHAYRTRTTKTTSFSVKMGVLQRLLGSLLLCSVFLCLVEGDVHYYDFVLKEANFTRLCMTKSMLVVNDSFPGPVIRVHKGDTVYVNVQNQGDYGLTIHWHGVHQPRNPWSDGPEYVTQCPIEPGTNFTYEVIFSDEEGTLWWHAHSDWTRAGVHGAIVVMPSDETGFPFPEPDGEEILVFGSWYYIEDLNAVVAEDVADGSDTPRSDCYTINGQPGDFGLCSKDSTYRWQVEYGKTYLLRLVSAVMNAELYFAIADHSLTVVGLDGAYVKPIVTDNIMISPGQTMDILVTANQSLGEYYMAARQFDSVRPDDQTFDKSNVTAILEYKGNYTPPAYPIFPSTLPSYEDLLPAIEFTNQIKSLASEDHPINVPMNITTKMYIAVEMNSGSVTETSDDITVSLLASLNNISWVNPTTDVLLAYYRNISGFYASDFPDFPPYFYDFVSDDLPDNTELTLKATKVKVLEYNEEVEIVFQGTNTINASENHPMHLHGYSFYLVGSGFGNFDNVRDPQSYNLVDPPKMTTISVPMKGWAAIRFKASNPGVWLWHCHLDRHFSWGMSFVLIVKDGGEPKTSMREPPPYMPPCTDSPTIRLRPSHKFSRTGK
uniref:laccase-14-like isoform X2 n=1 Tax=Fragaria vesca subsp. vesca TaxID=101020 RepID=UPI0005C94DC8|nr:PREDICTED: laccase-14-like isoform X2 [Fragaria vesca subsp. vesca]XP_011458459.1 PREDICTED: laccase-14-like isoform X2 [Fragaria vesca subsp. vesca]